MPSTNVALCIGVHIVEAFVPEEEDVLLRCDGLRIEKVAVYFGVWAKIEQMCWYLMEPDRQRIVLGAHCI